MLSRDAPVAGSGYAENATGINTSRAKTRIREPKRTNKVHTERDG
jgi:hypothetical protein